MSMGAVDQDWQAAGAYPGILALLEALDEHVAFRAGAALQALRLFVFFSHDAPFVHSFFYRGSAAVKPSPAGVRLKHNLLTAN
jgi:hypothetical protein